MNINFDKTIFETDTATLNKLGIKYSNSRVRTGTMNSKVIKVFNMAKAIGKKQLSIEELTIGYYNAITKVEGGKILTKGKIQNKLYILKKRGLIESVANTRGVYKLGNKNEN